MEFARLLEFNKKLIAIESVGISVNVDDGRKRGSLASVLERIQSDVAERIACGKSFNEALEVDSVPEAYRNSVQSWQAGDEAAVVFDPLTKLPGNSRISRSAWTMTRTRLALLLLVGLLVFLFHHQFTRPTWVRVFEQLGLDNRDLGPPSFVSAFALALIALAAVLLAWPWLARLNPFAQKGNHGDRPYTWTHRLGPWIAEGLIGGIVVAAAAHSILGPYVHMISWLG